MRFHLPRGLLRGRGRFNADAGRAAGIRIAFQARQIAAQIGCALIAEIAVLLHRFADDSFEFGGDFRIQAGGRSRSFGKNSFEDYGGSLAAEWQRSGDHLVENRAEREKIGAGVECLSFGLLGRHVGNSAEGCARAGEMHVIDRGSGERGGRLVCGTALCRHFRQAKIENLGVAALGDEYIRGLDVAVDDAFGVGGIERVGDFDGQREQPFPFPWGGCRSGT